MTAAERSGAKRFIHTSTWATFGLEHRELDEQTVQTGGRSRVNYTRTKFLAEEAVRDAVRGGLDAVIVNPSHIVGRYDQHNWVRLIRQVVSGTLPGVPPGLGSYCHAERVAAAEVGVTGESYLLGGADASFAELARLVGEVAGRPVQPRVIPGFILRTVAWLTAPVAAITGREPILTPEGVSVITAHTRVVSSKAERDLGYTPVPLRLMLEDTHRWLTAEGLL